jgi:hypothetical protein
MNPKFERHGYLAWTERIGSVAKYVDCMNAIWRDGWHKSSKLDPQEEVPWFRGVHNEDYDLIPGIYRGKDTIGWDYLPEEAEDMKAEFARRAVRFLGPLQHCREGEYLHLMQHYRFPTRLLDWTEGALIALHFAVTGLKADGTSKPCVWMLNPSWLNYNNDAVNESAKGNPEREECRSLVLYTDYWAVEKYPEDSVVAERYLCREERLTAKFPIAVFPPHIDARITAQRSVFTIHGRERNGFRILWEKEPESEIAKIPITTDTKQLREIRAELTTLGVTETTLFPDLEGLSREIQAEYHMKVRYP